MKDIIKENFGKIIIGALLAILTFGLIRKFKN